MAMFCATSNARAGEVGVPVPGCETKLAPVDGKLEVRFRGPHVMPGYWRAEELNRGVFDDEGFLRTGDALKPLDDSDPSRGFLFDGRLAEDFKLSSGTFVSVGPAARSHDRSRRSLHPGRGSRRDQPGTASLRSSSRARIFVQDWRDRLDAAPSHCLMCCSIKACVACLKRCWCESTKVPREVRAASIAWW